MFWDVCFTSDGIKFSLLYNKKPVSYRNRFFCHMIGIRCEICWYVMCNTKLLSKQWNFVDCTLIKSHQESYLPIQEEKITKHSNGKRQNSQIEGRWRIRKCKSGCVNIWIKINLGCVFPCKYTHTGQFSLTGSLIKLNSHQPRHAEMFTLPIQSLFSCEGELTTACLIWTLMLL